MQTPLSKLIFNRAMVEELRKGMRMSHQIRVIIDLVDENGYSRTHQQVINVPCQRSESLERFSDREILEEVRRRLEPLQEDKEE